MPDAFIPTFRDSEDYLLGIEVGVSICEFQCGYSEVSGEYRTENDEQIIAVASNFGYRVVTVKPGSEGMVFLRFRRGKKKKRSESEA